MVIKENCSNYGVGGRQAKKCLSSEGGGYLDNYRFMEFEKNTLPKKADPRLIYLRKIGLNATLQKIANSIGFDNFLKMWAILDKDKSAHTDSGAINLHIRSFKAWQRFERERLVKALSSEGYSAREISEFVKDQFGEKLHHSYISRLIRK